MQIMKQWPLRLISLPFTLRLRIVILSFVLCLILYGIFFPIIHNGTIVVIPVVLAAWFFKYRGAMLTIGVTVVAVLLVDLFIPSVSWRSSELLLNVIGFVSGAVIGLIASGLRHSVDLVEDAQRRAIEAERGKVLAFEQQRKAQEAEQFLALAYQQQQRLNQQKDLLLAHVNHELCTPLTALSGYLELLHDYHEQLDENQQMMYLQKALEECEELKELIANFLDTAQIELGGKSLWWEQIAIREAVQEVVGQLDPREVQDHCIDIDIPDQLTAWADRQYLRQILRNLLSNACKYSPKHSAIHIRSLPSATSVGETPQVCLSIQDSGPGIADNEIPLLFKKFARLPRDMTGSIRGTGLGLYISRQLVEAMGGRIWVESTGRDGEGSCFFFTLPQVKPNSLSIPVGSQE